MSKKSWLPRIKLIFFLRERKISSKYITREMIVLKLCLVLCLYMLKSEDFSFPQADSHMFHYGNIRSKGTFLCFALNPTCSRQ